ncbi:oxidoreductase [Mycolicibacterium insubricum]|uniref:Carboxylic acid reductase n=2 Tax=Mycolicibacterium insubricum TaxID=444597 RepID=A0A1X0D333_9MYCO|nr:carboxylic acid reductase [Mycolicibacterium insubricum]ORA66629.1 oxidoreductase [Mycolicibacterium insubricum]BBZ66901.1 oxidoreductase [Mycolicibacterium insubricum]
MPVASSPNEPAGTARLNRRISELYATDPQFAAARPDPEVAAAVDAPGLDLATIVNTVLTGYGDRPAVGERARRVVTDPATGRSTTTPAPHFDTLTYRELHDRVRAVTDALADTVAPGDRVAILGFTSVDYATVDLALIQLAAVSVPLQTSASAAALTPIIAETEPRVLAASVVDVAHAVDLIEAGPGPSRLVVFDIHDGDDDHRDALAAARARLHDSGVVVETLAEVIRRGRTAAPAEARTPAVGEDPLALLVYTSGSTGAPKGAMYPQSRAANMWRSNNSWQWDDLQATAPSIVLCFLPMSHVMGRGILYGALSAGGTAYFAARPDLSTLIEDLSLVRPTQLNFVPRIWDMLHQEWASERDRAGRLSPEAEAALMRTVSDRLIGNRYVLAITGSAPISPELRAWVETFLDLHLVEGYGSTEAGAVMVDGVLRRPPVTDYKLVDVPELGYLGTDRPYPRGELLLKSAQLFPGYYHRPEVSAGVLDDDGFYRTGDIFAETAPATLVYVDRRNNVLKLSQGEFVTLSKLEAAYLTSPLISQIYLYGNSARPYLLAVIVPTAEALAGDPSDLRGRLSESLKRVAAATELQSYEIPRDFLVETEPFTQANGLLTGIRKLAWPKLKERYGDALEALYAELSDGQAAELARLRTDGAAGPVAETVGRAAAALLGTAAADIAPDAHFTDLGGDSLSALTYSNLLHDIFGVDVPVGLIVSPATDLAAIAAHIEAARAGATRPSYDGVHGRDATVVRAADLTLDKFLPAETLSAAPGLPGPRSEVRTVLLTGATGFLGRYLALEWLERMDLVDGKLICLVRARSYTEAAARLDATFDSGDPELLAHYRELAADHLEVLAGDKGEENLGLDPTTWARLAADVDLIVDPAALVNHVLPYRQLFAPNALGTAELIRIALSTRIKPYLYVSTIGVGDGMAPGTFVEDADIRATSPTRAVDDSYANGYGNSKWAGEVLLREAHDLCGLPTAVFRCDMILADTSWAGQLNLPDMFTRMMLSLVATGIAPESFTELDPGGHRQPSHYDGLPVEFIAEAVSTLGTRLEPGEFVTYHVMNPYDDGIGMDEFVDWLIEAGYPISRVPDYQGWLDRFDTALRGLPDRQRQASLLPLLHNYTKPGVPQHGSLAPTEVFRAAVQDAKIGPDKDIPHVSREVIVKYATDLELLGLL